MGFCKHACTCVGVSVVALAVFIGFLTSEYSTPFFQYLDQYAGGRGKRLMGIVPAVHRGIPWRFTHDDMAAIDLTGQTILVTGANVGLGYWTAHSLAVHTNAKVVMACRSESKCNAARDLIMKDKPEARVETITVDLGSFASIRSCAQEFLRRYEQANSLILNAGIMMPPFQKTVDGIESQMGVNHFGHFLLTRLLMPAVLRAAAGDGVATIVAVSSSAHYNSHPEGIMSSLEEMNKESRYDRRNSYGQSKLANVLFAQELAERYKDQNVLVNSIHPGAVKTELGRHILDFKNPLLKSMVESLKTTSQIVWDPRDAALTQLYAAVSPDIIRKRVTGKYFHPIAREAVTDPHAWNMTLQKQLWALSEDAIAKL